jgi:hypothetical protein
MVWGSVVYMVIYIDPAIVRDIGFEGLYLPFITLFTLSFWYTIVTVTSSWKLATALSILTGLALILSIIKLMNWFTMVALILLMGFTLYLHMKRDSVNESVDSVR